MPVRGVKADHHSTILVNTILGAEPVRHKQTEMHPRPNPLLRANVQIVLDAGNQQLRYKRGRDK